MHIKFSTVLIQVVLSLFFVSISFGQSVPQKSEQTTIQNQIILKLKSTHKFNISTNKKSLGLQQIDQIAAKQGAYTIRQMGMSTPKTAKKNRPNFENIVVLKYDNNINIEQAIKDFEASGMVEYAEPNGMMYGSSKVIEDRMAELGYEAPQITPNDQYYSAQWWAENDGTYHTQYQVPSYFPTCVVDADIDLEAAWDVTTGCSSVVIALLDTGMKLDHPEMAGRIIGGYDFINDDNDPTDDHGHGTNVGGIAFANGNEGGIHAGVNWNSDVLIVKVLDENNVGPWTRLAEGIIWAVDNGATIMNASIGGQGAPQVLEDAVQYAYDNNVALITSAGNDDQNIESYPAVYAQTISVGATTCNDARASNTAWGSNYHPSLDLVAPGSSIYGLYYQDNDWGFWFGGTSQSTPMVTGVASLMLCQDPNLSVEDIRTILRNTADDQVGKPNEDTQGYDIYHGAGRLNAEAALLAVSSTCTEGESCDDNDACTINDVYDADCNCAGTIADDDNDGVCNANDACPNVDDNLIGTSCDDGSDCTTNDVYDNTCTCAGTPTDADGDGVCDADDACPGVDDALIGTACDDGDPCTEGETYDGSCNCTGGTIADDDNDGVCNANDACPNVDDNLIGTSCDDGSDCTTNDVYDNTCTCAGTPTDADGDGVCDADDACPGVDDALIGTACDDGDPCTEGETYDGSCNCTGGTFADNDNDGVCDADDACPGGDDTADEDNNGIPDDCDNDGGQCTVSTTCGQYNFDDCSGGISVQAQSQDSIAIVTIYIGDVLVVADTCIIDIEEGCYGAPCDDGDDCTDYDMLDEDCNCVGYYEDYDDDGICDADDLCPYDPTNNCEEEECYGIPCDDGDDCTYYDMLDENCDCVGYYEDYDDDGICDADDLCPYDPTNNCEEDDDGYCDVEVSYGSDLRYISNVTLGNIDNDSQYDDYYGYSDFTNLSTNLSAGSTANISLTTDGDIPAFVMHTWGAWIDYNQDGDFDDAGEHVLSTTSTEATIQADIVVPANIVTGATRMRIIVKYGSDSPTPCENILTGEIEDYTVELQSSGVCTVGTPCDDGDACTTNDVLDAACNCAGTFTDSDADGICDADDECPSDPLNNCGGVPDYCESYGSNTDYEYIDRVAFADIDNTSGDDGGYGDYTDQVATVGLGDIVPIGLAPGFPGHTYNEVWTVWIDYNHDGHYDSHEKVYFGEGAGSLSEHVTIPANATLGLTGMRVTMQWNRPAHPCQTFTYGEVEDYLVNITDTPQNYPLIDLRNENNLVADPSVRIFPNPASDFIHINLQNARDNGSMTIITVSGKTVMQQDIDADTNDLKVAVNQLPAGVYLIRLDLGGNTYLTERFVKLSH